MFLLCSSSMASERVIELNWQLLYEVKTSFLKAYYDANGTVDIDETTRTGILLVVFDSPIKITVNNKEILVKSYARSFVVECKKKISAPMTDLYFLENFPTLNSIPIEVYTHSPGSKIQQFPIDSIINSLFCGPRV